MARTRQTARRITTGPVPRSPTRIGHSGNVPTIPQQHKRLLKPSFDPETWIAPMTNWATNSSLMQQVLVTPELLENILAHMDVRTLLVSGQRVSRGWNKAIASSPRLQLLLFFEAAHRSVSGDENGRGFTNPLLKAAFPAWFPQQDGYIHENEERKVRARAEGSNRGGDSEGGNVQAKEEGEEQEKEGSGEEEAQEQEQARFPAIELYPRQPFASHTEAFEFPDASWRRMLTHNNPPVRRIATWDRRKVWTGSSDKITCTFYHACGYVTEGQMSRDNEALGWAKHGGGRKAGIAMAIGNHTADDNAGLRMGQYFAFLLDQAITNAGPLTYLHFTWSGASSPYMLIRNCDMDHRKLPGLPDDVEVVEKWEEVAGTADLVVSHEHTKGWCGTNFGPAEWEMQIRELGRRMVGSEMRKERAVQGVEPLWQWKVDAVKRD